MQQQMQPQPQVAPYQMEEHKELFEMKQQMQEMKAQNARLTQMLMARMQQPLPQVAPRHYSHSELAQFFQKKKRTEQLTNQVAQELQHTKLSDEIAKEKDRLAHLQSMAS